MREIWFCWNEEDEESESEPDYNDWYSLEALFYEWDGWELEI